MKQTLEEAAKSYSKRSSASVFQENHKRDFISGAEWQAKKMYSEEDMRKSYNQGIDDSFDMGFSSKDDTNFNAFIEQFKKK